MNVLGQIDDEIHRLSNPETFQEKCVFPHIKRAVKKIRSMLVNAVDDRLWWVDDDRLTYLNIFTSGKEYVASATFDGESHICRSSSRSGAMKALSSLINGTVHCPV